MNTFRESRSPRRFSSYMALMSNIIDSNPTSVEEATDQHVWRDSMVEEYHSIMKNVLWDIVLRLQGKSMVGSRWIFKIKHVADGSILPHRSRINIAYNITHFSDIFQSCTCPLPTAF